MTGPGLGEAWLFWILAPLMTLASLGLLFVRKAVHAALSMAVVMVSLGGVYVILGAPFLGIVQVFVYTGAVMMLFLFVLMLVGVDASDSLVETIRGQRLAAVLAGLGFAVLLGAVGGRVAFGDPVGLAAANAEYGGNVTGLAALIFGRFFWAFELTGALLVTAALGAMVLAHRERLGPRPTQRSISEARLREGKRITPLPNPGVYARHNSADTPALLPDGSPSELSVSRVLTARGQARSNADLVDDVPDIVREIDPGHRGTGGRD
ncbi:MAG: NADH-quinone oxidoreductase subunit J [Kineosporiaceae bacterium]